MNKTKTIKPWITNFKAFFVLCISILLSHTLEAQNIIEKNFLANDVEQISINGNQIFNISVSATKTEYIAITSTLDGEYQNQYQIVTKQENKELKVSLEQIVFTKIADDKRNAHKVVAATLSIEIPENLVLSIKSDIGSVEINGNYDILSIALLRGYCEVMGNANSVTITTIEGDISVVTKNATINASSSHGNVVLDEFSNSESLWKLQSINGDIIVTKQD